MKQIMKKAFSVCTALLCAAGLMAASSVFVFAAAEMDDAMKEQLISTVESLTKSIVTFSDEDIAAYMETGDAFTISAMTSWESSKEELGAFKEIAGTDIEIKDDMYIVTVAADFETFGADFEYMFDETFAPVSMTVNVDYPMSVNMQRAAMNTLMGIGTVFVVLIFLSWFIGLFKFIPALLEGKKKDAEPVQEAPVVAEASEEEVVDDTELIAVIAAAIAAMEGTSPDGLVVRSVRKINRKKW